MRQSVHDRFHSHGNVHIASILVLIDRGRSSDLAVTTLISIGCAVMLGSWGQVEIDEFFLPLSAAVGASSCSVDAPSRTG